jgi:hypothetical protein
MQWEGGVTRAAQVERLVALWGLFGQFWLGRMKDEKSISAKKAFLRLLEPELNLNVAFVQN